MADSDHIAALAKLAAIEALAERLYWKLEHVDPTDGTEWLDLTEDERENFRICVRNLLALREEVLVALGET